MKLYVTRKGFRHWSNFRGGGGSDGFDVFGNIVFIVNMTHIVVENEHIMTILSRKGI